MDFNNSTRFSITDATDSGRRTLLVPSSLTVISCLGVGNQPTFAAFAAFAAL
jgi:hypothetical protein